MSGRDASPAAGSTPSERQELEHWEDITRKMVVPFHDDGIISQFSGYDELN